MCSIIKEIIETPFIVVENNFDNKNFPEFPLRLRRTHTMSCIYCKSKWGDIHYDGINRIRVCCNCKKDIQNSATKKRWNLHLVSKTIKNKKRFLEEIIEVGMHPDRIYQTQLVDTLYLFR